MGKIDDMRRLREQQAADSTKKRQVRAEIATTDVVVSSDAPLPFDPPKRRAAAEPVPEVEVVAAALADDRGKCSECGKMKPMHNGIIANHQKGLGKACSGSRKSPA